MKVWLLGKGWLHAREYIVIGCRKCLIIRYCCHTKSSIVITVQIVPSRSIMYLVASVFVILLCLFFLRPSDYQEGTTWPQ